MHIFKPQPPGNCPPPLPADPTIQALPQGVKTGHFDRALMASIWVQTDSLAPMPLPQVTLVA